MERVDYVLSKIGVPRSTLGYIYIKEAVEFLNKNKEGRAKDMYRHLADMYNSTPVRVERVIRHAFKTARAAGDNESVERYVGSKTANMETLHCLMMEINEDISKMDVLAVARQLQECCKWISQCICCPMENNCIQRKTPKEWIF